MTADKDVSARTVSDAECAVVAELVVRIRDRGPEWHTNRSLFGPWRRFEAELVGDAGVRAFGMSPWVSLYRLVANHRAQLAAAGGGILTWPLPIGTAAQRWRGRRGLGATRRRTTGGCAARSEHAGRTRR